LALEAEADEVAKSQGLRPGAKAGKNPTGLKLRPAWL
jgi:hypothetical protein